MSARHRIVLAILRYQRARVGNNVLRLLEINAEIQRRVMAL